MKTLSKSGLVFSLTIAVALFLPAMQILAEEKEKRLFAERDDTLLPVLVELPNSVAWNFNCWPIVKGRMWSWESWGSVDGFTHSLYVEIDKKMVVVRPLSEQEKTDGTSFRVMGIKKYKRQLYGYGDFKAPYGANASTSILVEDPRYSHVKNGASLRAFDLDYKTKIPYPTYLIKMAEWACTDISLPEK